MKRSSALGALAAVTLPFDVVGAALAQTSPGSTGSEAARDVVARQVAAVNAHDAAAVTKFHAPDATITSIPSGKALSVGADQMQASFVKLFAENPNFRLTMNKQYVFKNVVVNHYSISGGPSSELVSIYDVQNDVIAHEWVIFG